MGIKRLKISIKRMLRDHSRKKQEVSPEELKNSLPIYLTKTERDLNRLEAYMGRNEKWIEKIGRRINNNFILVCGSIPIFMAYSERTGGLNKDIYDRTISLLQKASDNFRKYSCLNYFADNCSMRLSYLEKAVNKFPDSLIKNNIN